MHADLGGRIAHTWVADGMSTLDLLGPGLTLITDPDPGGWQAAVARPDGVPVASWSGSADLRAAVDSATRRTAVAV